MSVTERMGVWRRGPWDWAYRFTLPPGHEHAGRSVYGCGFATRERALEAMRAAKVKYGTASQV